MKPFTGSLIALLFSLTGFAQDWAPYVPGQMSYYKDGASYLLRKVDTQIVRSSYTVQYFQPYDFSCIWDSTVNMRPLDSLIIRGDSFTYYYPATIVPHVEAYAKAIPDSLTFFFGKAVGFSWSIIIHSHNIHPNADTLQLSIASAYVDTFLGLIDSVKRIQISGFWSTTKNIFLSKHFGLIKGHLPIPRNEGLDFDRFQLPMISDKTELVGLTNDSLDIGFHFPEVQDFFGISAGDVVKWKTTYTYIASPVFYQEDTYFIDTILSTSLTPNEFKYSLKRKSVVNASPKDTFMISYGSFSIQLDHWRNRLLSNSLHTTVFNHFEQERVYLYSDSMNQFGLPEFTARVLFDYRDSCLLYPFPLGVDSDDYFEEHTISKGLGGTRYYRGSISYINEREISWLSQMVGYKGSQGVFGDTSPLQLGQSKNYTTTLFSVYPNPASYKIKLDLPSRVLQQGQLTIQDMLGRILIHGSLNGNPTVLVDQLQSGLYLISVIAEDQRYQTKLLIQ